MINNGIRVGNFTSSAIVALTKKDKTGKGFGKPALTYILETNMERRLGRSLESETAARPLIWGNLLERRVFDLLGLEYTLSSQETIAHPTISYWVGSPDGGKKSTTADIKSPWTLKSFCRFADAGSMSAIRELHEDGEKYYWQIVSNAILRGDKDGELIVYMPYRSELDEIRGMANMVDTDQLSRHYFIAMAGEEDLPYLPDDCFYNNIYKFHFEIPQEDKDFLTECVLSAGNLLVACPKLSINPPNIPA